MCLRDKITGPNRVILQSPHIAARSCHNRTAPLNAQLFKSGLVPRNEINPRQNMRFIGSLVQPRPFRLPQLKLVVTQIMRDQYVVKWRNSLDTDPRCEVYRIFKQEFCYEPYIK